MKLLRFGEAGSERPGILDPAGRIRDLSGIVPDIVATTLGQRTLSRLRALDPESLPVIQGPVRLGPCVAGVRNFVAVGLNYADHARETGTPIPSEPVLFNKAASCIVGPNDDIVLPAGSQKTDWEVELALVIGEPAHCVNEAEALSFIAGYCICHDVSERAFQIEHGGQWMKEKSAPTFGSLGPWLVTTDEIADVQDLALWLDVNGQRMQTGSTSTMIFGVTQLVAYTSQFMRLEPGDVITTGTPPGVGLPRKPPRFLRKGDIIELGIEGLGRQRQRVSVHAA